MRTNISSGTARIKCLFIISLIAVFCFAAAISISYAADSSDEETVYVGIIKNPSMGSSQNTGYVRGYDSEYMYKIAQYADVRVKFIYEDNYDTMLSDLESGKLEMAFGITKSDPLTARFLYSSRSTDMNPISISARSDDSRFEYGNPSLLNGKKGGIIKGSMVLSAFDTYCSENSISTNITKYDTRSALHDALKNGSVDYIVTGKTQTDDFSTVLQFSPISYYIAFNKNNFALKDHVDAAMSRLEFEDEEYPAKLYHKYSCTATRKMAALTAAEKSYIASHPVVKVAIIQQDAPFSETSYTGKISGIIPAYYKKLSTICGLKFEFTPYGSYDKMVKAVQDGRADVAGMVSDDIYTADSKGLVLTRFYTEHEMMQITRSSTGDIHTVAVRDSDADIVNYYYSNSGSKVTVKGYVDVNECYKRLRKGEVDAVVCPTPYVTWLMNQHRATDYKITNLSTMNWTACGAVTTKNETLGSILSKAAVASGSEIDGMIANNIMPGTSLQVFLDKLPVSWIVVFFITVLFMAIIYVVLLMNNRRDKEHAILMVTNAKLSAAEEAKNEEAAFLSSMSHDMRTPLNGIIGFTSLALNDHDPYKREEYLKKIDSSSKLMLGIVNDVLDISKIASGKTELHPKVFSIREIFDSVTDSMRHLADAKNIDLDADVGDTGDTYISADISRIQQVLLNLLSNAVKYTDPGGTVRFTLDLSGSDLVATISDNGIGMSPEFQAKMFEPFEQEERNIHTSSEGTGLGLSIVKQIIDMMRGTITVDSRIGEGSTFTVVLPVSRAGAESHADIASSDTQICDLSGKRILLCEDNEINAEIADKLLREWTGAISEHAWNGQEGLDMIKAAPSGYYTAIFMDIRMPVMDGLEATGRIRAIYPDIPIIAMTADAYSEDIRQCLDAGMDAHIAKPIDPKNLASTLNTVLASKIISS